MNDFELMSHSLQDVLNLSCPPIAISFLDAMPDDIEAYGSDYPAPTEDGRTGAVSAGCVFWIRAAERTFSTIPEDHGNCSVGSLTHGLIDLEQAANKADVKAVCEAKWVSPEVFPHIPTVSKRPKCIVYGPLAEVRKLPDVVFLRVNAKQAMQLHSALPTLRFEGKPQCHIIPLSVEQQQPAISVGCMLSQVRTGMTNNEMSCALPGAQVADMIDALRQTVAADRMVAGYASQDAGRFDSSLDRTKS